ncbi:MAG: hypothetical protein IPJ61_18365 [Tessaracoccus sp.]|uniref:hypothetical protein n=1 Tax=Tessaracoccus sp. TaxID=1971211 RepID=UPI001EB83514|nr:hypothetical protein [Tessaracoccus sp.]MBK7822949.1 hypothetical protein [Tessaracoccus sp.]
MVVVGGGTGGRLPGPLLDAVAARPAEVGFGSVGDLIGLLRQVDERLPVVLRCPPEARGIAVEVATVAYLPADAIVALGACLVLMPGIPDW